MNELYEKLWDRVKKAQNVLVIGHRKPDGDALGSMFAVKIWLSRLGKSVKLACIDKPSKRYNFLPFFDEIENEINPEEHDLVMVLDCGAHYMTGFHTSYPEMLKDCINIDHHASNDNFGSINIVDHESASATIIIYRIFEYLDVEITPEMATCLLVGIYNDTGSFMHSNTSHEVYFVAGELLKKGAQISRMIKSLFRTNTVSTLKVWGKAFENARVTDGNFLLSVLKKDDVEKEGESDQVSGAIDYLNMVPGVDFAFLLKEESGNVKGSLRTRRDDLDLSEIAKLYGGGGHPKASGFVLPGKIEQEVRYKIISEKLEKQPLNL
jgi:phosphoesterase RecJ-like protein